MVDKTIFLFSKMIEDDCRPNEFTYSHILNLLVSEGQLARLDEVLKERGVDSVAVEQVHLSHWIEQDVPKGEILHVRYNGKAGNVPLDHRIVKNIDRDHHRDAEKSDFQRKNWRSENRRNNRDLEKQQPDRPLSPETWRKPVDQPTSPTGLRYGKAASAVELAQAFSKSVSDPKTSDRVVRGQIPFSRLTVPQPRQSRPHSNGY